MNRKELKELEAQIRAEKPDWEPWKPDWMQRSTWWMLFITLVLLLCTKVLPIPQILHAIQTGQMRP
jgi:hypothetical protein